MAKIRLQCRSPQFSSWARKIIWKRNRPPTSVFLGFPYGSTDKGSACSVEDVSSIPGLERFPWRRERLPTLKCSGLKNSMNCIIHGVTESQTQLSDFHCHFTFREISTSNANIPSLYIVKLDSDFLFLITLVCNASKYIVT